MSGLQSTVFRVLDLPAELRNNIYFMLVGNVMWYMDTKYPRDTSAILRVCQQIREEARGIYYSTNVFRFDVHPSLRRFDKDREARTTLWVADAAKWMLSLERKDFVAILQIEAPDDSVYNTKTAGELAWDLIGRLRDGGISDSDMKFALKLLVASRVPEGSAMCCDRGECITKRVPPGFPAAPSFVTGHLLGVSQELRDVIKKEKQTQGDWPTHWLE